MNKDKFSKWSLPLFWIFSFLVIIFMITLTASAEEVENNPEYPLIIDFAKNPADTTLEEIQNAYSIMWGDLPDNYIIYCGVHDQIYINGSHGWDYYEYFQYTVSVNPVFDYPLELSVTSPYYYITNGIEYYFDYIPDIDHWGSYNSATNIRHQYAYSYMAQGLGWLLYGTEDDYTSTSDVVVWSHRYSGDINTGVAIIPPPFIIPEYFTGETPPPTVPPSYTINNYTWTTAPSFDGSSVINGIQSIKDTLEWLADNLKNSFSNLLNNLKGLAEYISKTIQYYGNAIIETLNNFIQNFYDNMKSLVEPIVQKLEYFTEPLDFSAVETELHQTSFYNLYNSANSIFLSYKDYFDDIPQINSLSFTVPFSILTKSGYVTFDFNWYANIRNDILPWIVGFLYAGFGLALFRSIPSIIHGVSGVLQKGG